MNVKINKIFYTNTTFKIIILQLKKQITKIVKKRVKKKK